MGVLDLLRMDMCKTVRTSVNEGNCGGDGVCDRVPGVVLLPVGLDLSLVVCICF